MLDNSSNITKIKKRIAILLSGGGTNFQAILDASNKGELPSGNIELVISNKKNVYGLQRAEDNNIPSFCIVEEDSIIRKLNQENIDLIVLAGYMKILSPNFVKSFEGRILNIHPSLIPSFCGKGCYGLNVHKMVLDYGVKVTGATVHFVNEIPDGGKIISQKAVDVYENDTPESLQRRVMEEAEWIIYPKAIEEVAKSL